MIELITVFLTENAVVISTSGAALGIVEYVFAPFRTLRKRNKKPEKVEIANPEALMQTANTDIVPSEPVVTLTLAQLDARLDAREANVRAKLENAEAEDRALLQSQLDELANQKANIDNTLKNERARIADLENRLTREGNDIGGDRLAEAKAAMEQGDYSAADDLFAEIEARDALAVQSSARAAFARGEIAEAEVRWADAAEHYGRAAGIVPGLVNLIKAQEFALRSGDYTAALRFGELALVAARKTNDNMTVGKVLNEQASLLNATGRYDEAETILRENMRFTEAAFGKSHPNYFTSLNNLAQQLRAIGSYDEAEPLFREAMQNLEAALGRAHPTYATSLNNLAGLLRATGRTDEAEPLYREALSTTEAALGKAHPEYARSLNNLGGLLRATGRYEEAEPLYREAIEIRKVKLGNAHPDYGSSLNNLAILLAKTERFEEALPLMEQALAIFEAALGAEHPNTKASKQSLAAIRKDAAR